METKCGVEPHCFYCVGQENTKRCEGCVAWSKFWPTRESRENVRGATDEDDGNEPGEL